MRDRSSISLKALGSPLSSLNQGGPRALLFNRHNGGGSLHQPFPLLVTPGLRAFSWRDRVGEAGIGSAVATVPEDDPTARRLLASSMSFCRRSLVEVISAPVKHGKGVVRKKPRRQTKQSAERQLTYANTQVWQTSARLHAQRNSKLKGGEEGKPMYFLSISAWNSCLMRVEEPNLAPKLERRPNISRSYGAMASKPRGFLNSTLGTQ